MKLADWLREKGLTQEAFGRQIEVQPQSVYRYCSGKRVPDDDVMRRIIVATDGAVTPNDFYDLPAPAAATPTLAADAERADPHPGLRQGFGATGPDLPPPLQTAGAGEGEGEEVSDAA